MDEPAYAICVRVADLDDPVAGSTTDTCAECAEDVWVSIASRHYVQEEDAVILCAHCGIKQMATDAAKHGAIEIVTNDLQRKEIKQELLGKRL